MVPQIPLINLKIDDVLVLSSDYLNIQADAIQIAGEVISRRLAHLSFVGDFIPKFIGSNKVEDDERSPTVVIPMGVLDANEMSFNDDVKILDNYEEIIETFFLDRTQEDSSFKMQIGGDQLTRERLNHALSLRRHNPGRTLYLTALLRFNIKTPCGLVNYFMITAMRTHHLRIPNPISPLVPFCRKDRKLFTVPFHSKVP